MVDEKDTTAAASPAEVTRPFDYFLVHHMARSRRTRTLRAARAGHRRQGVILDDGTRIKKRGERFTEIGVDKFLTAHSRLLEYVRVGAIEVHDPRTMQPIPYDELISVLKTLGKDLVGKGFKVDESAMVPQGPVPGSSSTENMAPIPPEDSDLIPSEEEAEAVIEAAAEPQAEPEPEETGPGYTEEELNAMTRKELNKLAEKEFDVRDPASLSNKQAVIDAILAKR